MTFTMKLIKIIWMDARGLIPEWEYLDRLTTQEPAKVTTVGFVLEDTDEYITVVQSICEDQILGRLTIPKVSILSMRGMR